MKEDTPKMNPEIKELWLARIAKEVSNPWFVLATHQLRRGEDSYSVLGLLCEIYHQETWEGEWIPCKGEVPHVNYMFRVDPKLCPSYSLLPTEVRVWAGLADLDPWMQGRDTFHHSVQGGASLQDFYFLIQECL